MNFYPSCLPFPPQLVRQEQQLEATQQATDLSRVLDILNETEAILTASDFEPTPLGPNVLFLSTDKPSSSSSSSSDEPIVSHLPSSLKRGFVNTDEDDHHHSSSMMFQQVFQEEEPDFSGSNGYAAFLLASSPEPKKRRLDFSPSSVSGMGMSGANINNFHHHQEEEEEDSRGHFRQYQADQWNDRFQELLDYKEATGHCLVPHDYPTNQKLAQWVKRQRYQYKLKQAGRHSTLTDARQMELESFGFVWDSHQAAWDEKYETLKAFRMMYGHCNVPSHYSEDKALAVWIKCQRRQMKLLLKGQKTSLNECRISRLNGLAFEWNPRNL